MTSGFQQQVPTRNVFTRSAPEAQHGKKTDEHAAVKEALNQKRSFEPRPGH
jgi:hypothetical protein